MCYCNPTIKTPFCGSQMCIDAAKELGHNWCVQEKEECCSMTKNQCWDMPLEDLEKMVNDLD